MSNYENFANFYDFLTDDVNYASRSRYIINILKKNGINSGILLDLACGTGNMSMLFSNAGYDVICVDSSEQMLSVAKCKADSLGISDNILFLCQYMQELDLYGTIDCAVCTLDSINHLTELEDVQETFDKVSLFMNKKGVFIFDVNTPYKHSEILGNNTFVYDNENVFCVWQNEYFDDDKSVDIYLDFFVPDNGVYRRKSECFSERAYTDSELTKMLKKSGFTVKSRFAEMTEKKPSRDTQRVVYVAIKNN